MSTSQHEMTQYVALPAAEPQTAPTSSPLYAVAVSYGPGHAPMHYAPQYHSHTCTNCNTTVPAVIQHIPYYYNDNSMYAPPQQVPLASEDLTGTDQDSTRVPKGLRTTLIVLAMSSVLLAILGFALYAPLSLTQGYYLSVICPPISHGLGLIFGIWQLIASIVNGKNLLVATYVSFPLLAGHIVITVLTMLELEVYGAVLIPFTVAFLAWMIAALCATCKGCRH